LKKQQDQNSRAKKRGDEYKHGIGFEAGNADEALPANAEGCSNNKMSASTAMPLSIQK